MARRLESSFFKTKNRGEGKKVTGSATLARNRAMPLPWQSL
jgi:hypothetical protein